MEKQLKEIIRSVVREQFISELSKNDVHVKEIMKFYDKGTYSTKKAVSIFVSGKANATKNQILDDLGDLDYNEIWDVMDHFKLKLEGLNEADVVPGGLAKGLSLNDIAEKHGVSVDMMVAEFKKGIAVEMEHTTDREVAKEITLDHLFEDPKYYDKLAKVEEYIDDKGVEHVAAALPQTEEEPVNEEKPGLWANIRAKRARGEAPAHKNSQAHKDAVKAGKEINKDESVSEALVKGKTYGGSKCEGGCFVGKTGLMKIIKISKDSPKDVFMFRQDNFSGLQPHFIKNGVIAKATVINPAYDLEKHKVRNLKIGNDVILSVRLFVSTNESVNECKIC